MGVSAPTGMDGSRRQEMLLGDHRRSRSNQGCDSACSSRKLEGRIKVTTIVTAALKYASRGLYIFPVVPDGKKPLTPHGFLDASCDQAQVRAWWERWPNANIGLATGRASGVIVVDYDCKHGKPGLKTRESLHRHFEIDTLTAT